MEFSTIILTCYKQEKYIEETILSVVNQTNSHWELLIWDDSPDDECRKIIEKYTQKYPQKIHAWHHSPNKWIVDNILFLLSQKEKKSDYIVFLEGDDCLFPQYLEKKLDIFTKDPEIKLVCNELSTIDDEGELIEEKHLHYLTKNFWEQKHIEYQRLFLEIFYCWWSTLMVKSEMIENYSINLHRKFEGERTLLSDFFFFCQIAHHEKFYAISEPLTLWRLHHDSTSAHIKNQIRMAFGVMSYANYLFKNWEVDEKAQKEIDNKCFMQMSILTVLKCLNIGILVTIKNFVKEYVLKLNLWNRCKIYYRRYKQKKE